MIRHLLLVLLSVCAWTAGFAQIPRTISFTGVLTDVNGVVRPDGVKQLAFRLFVQASGGTAVWTESAAVATTRGLLEHALGSLTPFPETLVFDRAYWLEVQEQGQAAQPRVALRMQPYAYRAVIADSAARAPLQPIADGSITAQKIAPGSVVTSLKGLRDVVDLIAENNGMLSITVDGQTITLSVRDSVSNAGRAAIADSALRPGGVPVGTVVAFYGVEANLPNDWRICDGAEIDPNQFPALRDLLVAAGLVANRLPDLRGYFLRGSDSTSQGISGIDPDFRLRLGQNSKIGSIQQDTLRSHKHVWPNYYYGTGPSNAMVYPSMISPGQYMPPHWFDAPSFGGAETRPKNIAVHYIIKVR
jgi:hypothetical protein